jgi:hypothetical protein
VRGRVARQRTAATDDDRWRPQVSGANTDRAQREPGRCSPRSGPRRSGSDNDGSTVRNGQDAVRAADGGLLRPISRIKRGVQFL